MKRIADFYVLLEARGSYNKAVAVAARTSKPRVGSKQIAVRVRLTLPDNAFTTWTPLVEAEVDPATLIQPTIDVIESENEAPAGIGSPDRDSGAPVAPTSRQEQSA